VSEITMPRLSDSMEEGTILKWLAADGDEVAPGQELLEVETDKATVTVECEVAGALRILVEEGSTVSVGTVIAQAGSDVEAPAPAVSQPANGGARSAPAPAASNGARLVTPLARRAAREHGVVLDELTGSGPRGRITRADVLAAAGVEVPAPSLTPAPAPVAAGDAVGLTRIQQVIGA
jgi:pyruvate dehydrogenase E2 component (dihydrolipoamide acetyltransferase)